MMNSFLMNRLMRIFSIVALTVVMFGFQNCSFVDSSSSSSDKDIPSSLGNGDPYSGIESKPGTYYYVVEDDYKCETNPEVKIENIAKILVIESSSDVAQLTDNCTGDQLSIPLAAVVPSLFDKNVVNIAEMIFLHKDNYEPDRVKLFRPIAKCIELNKQYFSLSREFLVYKKIFSGEIFTLLYSQAQSLPKKIDIDTIESSEEELVFSRTSPAFELFIDLSVTNRNNSHPSTVQQEGVEGANGNLLDTSCFVAKDF